MGLSLANLTVTYPDTDTPAVENFSLNVAAGELVLLAGPAGCGKSTLLAAISGVIPQARQARVTGQLSVFGHDPRHTPLAVMG